MVTATDIVAARGLAPEVGDASLTSSLDADLVERGYAEIVRIIEDAVDAMKTSAGDVKVVLVGGGSQVSGQIAKVFSLSETPRAQAIEESKRRACDEAIAAGADPATVEVIEVEDIPMAYLGDALCIRVKAVGDLML